LTYQSAIPASIPITINEGTELDLHVQAGAPVVADTYTFILNAGLFRSTSTAIPAISAGAFPAGSKLIIILRNGADWQSKGGRGGRGGDCSNIPGEQFAGSGLPGQDAGIVYSANGVDTDIYLSGTDPEGGAANGTLFAPGGGESGFDAPSFNQAGDGGDGGKGSVFGGGGDGGSRDGTGTSGIDGVDDVTPLGQIGATNGSSPGGLSGKGLVKSGAIVKVFGDTPANFINGGGDTPSP